MKQQGRKRDCKNAGKRPTREHHGHLLCVFTYPPDPRP
jgi:hypothetical protein